MNTRLNQLLTELTTWKAKLDSEIQKTAQKFQELKHKSQTLNVALSIVEKITVKARQTLCKGYSNFGKIGNDLQPVIVSHSFWAAGLTGPATVQSGELDHAGPDAVDGFWPRC